jgi:hypothetical protein
MKGFILTASFVLSIFLSRAQGPQQLVTVPIGPGSTADGWLYLPADYATTTKKYPVVFFHHGSAEAGNDPNELLNGSIPKLIAQGMRPDNIINPMDGQPYSFIVLSLQHWSWSPSPTWIPYELDWLKANYRIDTNRVYVTGLSAGGQTGFHTVVHSPEVSRLIAAAAPMSPAALGSYDSTMISQYKIKTWFFSGDQDAFLSNAINYNAVANRQFPGSSRLTIYPGGHCCWDSLYNVSWHEGGTGLSVWEWFLTSQRTMQVLPVVFTSFKVTDLGGKKIRVDFTTADEEGNEEFYIRVRLRGRERNILVKPEDKTGDRKYSKVINLDE